MSFIYYDETEMKTTEKPRLTILIRPPGSDKTTWCKMKVGQGYNRVW